MISAWEYTLNTIIDCTGENIMNLSSILAKVEKKEKIFKLNKPTTLP